MKPAPPPPAAPPRGVRTAGELAAWAAALPADAPVTLGELDDDARPAQGPVPPRLLSGKPNIEHFRARLSNLNALAEWHQRRKGNLLKGFEGQQRGILNEAKLNGFLEKDVAAGLGVEDRTVALIERLIEASAGDTPLNSLLEADDAELELLSESMDRAIEGCVARLEELQAAADADARDYRVRVATGKKWAARLKTLRRARADARDVFPKHRPPFRFPRNALEASRVLRRMLYIMRSDLPKSDLRQIAGSAKSRRAESLLLHVPRHVCRMAVKVWMAERGAVAYAKGTAAECRAAPEYFTAEGGVKFGVREVKGCVLVGPPRHMKTTFGAAWCVNRYIEDHRQQGMLLHAVEDKASENYNLVRKCFRQQPGAAGAEARRTRALFPGLRVAKSTDSETRFQHREATKNAQMSYASVRMGRAGINTDFQWWDDPVERMEADAADQRDRTHKQLTQVYWQRLQGRNPFLLVTATLWHHEDAVSRLIAEAEAGRVPLDVLIQAAGGPKASPVKAAWEPVWPELYPAAWLREQYRVMQDPMGYACQFMADPRPDELRIVKRLALYPASVEDGAAYADCAEGGDGDCGECLGCALRAHREFMATAQFHLSLDPAATAREARKRHTDKAGLLYAGVGDVVRRVRRGGGVVEERSPRLRIVDAESFFASGTEAVERVAAFAATRRVDRVHVEVVGFSGMILDSLRAQFGLASHQAIGHPPKNQSKEQRLRSVAHLLDDSLRDAGLAGAAVEFPGVVTRDGSLVPDPRYAWVSRQIVDFGQGEDHVLDALTQLLKHVGHELAHGRGAVTAAVLGDEPDDPRAARRKRIADHLASVRAGAEASDVYDEERRFMAVDAGTGDLWS